MTDPVKVVVPPDDFDPGPIAEALWGVYGVLYALARKSFGDEMAASIMASRLTRELRRDLGIEGAKAAMRQLADTMDAAAENDDET